MIKIFKSNLFFNALLLLPYAFLIRAWTFVEPRTYVPTDTDTDITHMVFGWMSSPVAQSVVACFLLFLQALMINQLTNKNKLAKEQTLLSGLFLILLSSLLPSYSYLSPVMWAVTFFSIGCMEIYDIYKKPHTATNIFNAGFFFAMGMLFYPTMYVYILFGFIAILILKSLGIVEFLQIVIGVLTTVYLYYSLALFLNHDLSGELSKYAPGINVVDMVNVMAYLKLFVLMIGLFVICLFGYNGFMIKKSIEAQKKINLTYWSFAFSLILLVFAYKLDPSLALFGILPASILLHMAALNIKNNFLLEVIHIGLVALVFFFHIGIL